MIWTNIGQVTILSTGFRPVFVKIRVLNVYEANDSKASLLSDGISFLMALRAVKSTVEGARNSVAVDHFVFFATEVAIVTKFTIAKIDAICSEILEQLIATAIMACLEEGECVVVIE